MTSAVTTVLVVIPVRDEEALLGRCLTAIDAAVATATEAGLVCIVRVVLDRCTDGSAEVAARYPFPTLAITAGRVGAARRAGIESGLSVVASTHERRIWIANTDADSAVPPNWITHQAALAARGADVVLGTVRPDFDDLSKAHRRHWLITHPRGAPAGNVHGANLGIRSDTYLRAGGFAPLAQHEDVGLVSRCRSAGAVIGVTDESEVVTSGRFVGRSPAGYAAFLRRLAADLDRGEPDAVGA